jgi:hypothetical protein
MWSDSAATLAAISTWVEWANVIVSLLLAVRLVRTQLLRRYPMLTLFVVFTPLALIALEFVPRNTNLYAEAYLGLLPPHWILYFAIAYETYRRVLEEHPGIASAGRWLISVGLVIAVLITALSLTAEMSARDQRFPILLAAHTAERAISTTLTLLLAILLGFTLYFPVLLRRNSVLMISGLTAFFLSKSLILLLRNLLGPDTYLVLSLGNQLVSLIVVGVWLVHLVPLESDSQGGPRASVPRERAEQMLRQLGALNEVLLRGGGR